MSKRIKAILAQSNMFYVRLNKKMYMTKKNKKMCDHIYIYIYRRNYQIAPRVTLYELSQPGPFLQFSQRAGRGQAGHVLFDTS